MYYTFIPDYSRDGKVEPISPSLPLEAAKSKALALAQMGYEVHIYRTCPKGLNLIQLIYPFHEHFD